MQRRWIHDADATQSEEERERDKNTEEKREKSEEGRENIQESSESTSRSDAQLDSGFGRTVDECAEALEDDSSQ